MRTKAARPFAHDLLIIPYCLDKTQLVLEVNCECRVADTDLFAINQQFFQFSFEVGPGLLLKIRREGVVQRLLLASNLRFLDLTDSISDRELQFLTKCARLTLLVFHRDGPQNLAGSNPSSR